MADNERTTNASTNTGIGGRFKQGAKRVKDKLPDSDGKIGKAASKVKSAFRRPHEDTNTLQPQLPATSGPEWVAEDADPFLAPQGPTDPYIADPDSEPDPTEKTNGTPYVPAPGVEGKSGDKAYVPDTTPGERRVPDTGFGPTTPESEPSQRTESTSTPETRPVGPMAFMNQPQTQPSDEEQDQEKSGRYDPWW